MKPSHLSIISLAVMLFSVSTACAAIYQEQSGQVVIEAEHFHSRSNNLVNNHHWHVVPDDDGVDFLGDAPAFPVGGFLGARDGKYIQNLPESGANNTSDVSVNNAPWVEYKVYIQTPGTYRLYLRWRGYDGNSDSMYAQIVELKDGIGGSIADWYGFSGGANVNFASSWRTAQAPERSDGSTVTGTTADWVIANAGVYTIHLSHREDGVAVDTLSLQLTNIAAPTEPGPPESPISTATPPFVRSRTPSLGQTGVFPDATIIAEIEDASKQTDANAVTLALDGIPVSPVVSKTGGITTVSFTPNTLFAPGSTHTVQLIYADTGSPAGRYTNTWNFVVENYGILTAEHAVPAASVDTTSSGFTILVAQGKDNAAYPGPDLPTNIKRAEDQLAGRLPDLATGQLMPNFALPGSGPGGTYSADLINWNQNQSIDPSSTVETGNFQSTSAPPFPDQGIPGIPGTDPDSSFNIDNVAAEMVTYFELSAGLHRFGVNSDDGFRVTAAADPHDPTAMQLGVFNGPRSVADSLFSVFVETNGIYPVRLVWFEGGGSAAVEFFSVDLASGQKILINDRSNPAGVRAYKTLNTVARPYVSVSPLHNAVNVPAGTAISVQVFDQTTALVAGSISLSLNGISVTPFIIRNGSVTWVTHDPPGLLPSGSTNRVTLVYSDNGTPAVTVTNSWQFVVQNFSTFPVIPASYAVPLSSVDTNSSGFTADVYQMNNGAGAPVARTGFANNNSVEAAEFQLARRFIDPATSQPYPNLASPGTEPDGRHVVDVVNWNEQAPANAGGFNNGNGYPDSEIPGLFAADQNWVVAESISYLELKAGIYQMVVNCDDGFKLTSGPDPRHVFNVQLGLRSPGGGATDTSANFVVEQDGIYPIRLLWWEGTGGASVEFIVVDQNTGARRLVNDRTTYFAVKAYRVLTGQAIPYIKSVKPRIGETVVPANTSVEAVLVNLGANPLRLYLDGVQVSPTVTPSGTNTLVSYTPASLFDPGSSHTVALAYGNLSNSWSFSVATGPKVVFVVANPAVLNASDAAIAAHVESFGFDLLIADDTASQTADAEGAVLIMTSSTVGSAEVGNKFRLVFVPVLSWEQALQDNFLMTGDVTDVDRGEVTGQTNVVIVNATHPMAGGLSASAHTVGTSPQTFTWGAPAPSATVIATLDDGTSRACIYGYDNGAVLIDGTTAAPARRVHVFLSDNVYAALTADGLKLIDAALSWAMNRSLGLPAPQITSATISGGIITIQWTNGGTLQSTTSLTSPNWSDAGTGGSFTESAIGMKFYRVVR